MAKFQTYFILHELLESFKDLQQDPKKFEANIKKAYEISEGEKDRLAAARKTIEDSKKLSAELDAKSKALGTYERELDVKRSALDDLANRHEAARQEITTKETALNQRTQELKDAEKTLTASKKELGLEKETLKTEWEGFEKRNAALTAKEKKVADYEKTVLAYEADLKDRAAKLRAQTDGLV